MDNLGDSYLGVGLGAVGGSSSVKRDDLMTEDVLAGSKRLRNGDGPGVVLADHLDGSPLAVLVAVGIDLGPLEGGLVNGGDVAVVRSNVCDDGTDVGLGPCVPVELDGASGGDLGHGVGRTLGRGVLVADDVGLAEGVRLNEAIVEILGVPAHVVGGAGLVVVVVEEEALLVLAVDGDTVDSAVGKGAGSEGGDGSDLGKHVDCLKGG